MEAACATRPYALREVSRLFVRSLLGLALLLVSACANGGEQRTRIRVSGSAVGAEGEVLRRQIRRFIELHPDIEVELVPTPDSADQRHQLYVQWLNAGAESPDVLQLDVVWTAELAAAGWLLPLDAYEPETEAFFEQAIDANRYGGRLYALPLFVDAGMLYWRTDLLDHPPRTFDELYRQAERAMREHGVRHGFVWQGARYEGLVTLYLEYLVGFGGQLVDEKGEALPERDAAVSALSSLREAIQRGITPRAVLAWQEEQTRFAFQNGDAVFMRNWPYAYPLMQDRADSAVAGRFAVAPMPAGPGGRSAATLGGAQLAVNARSRHPDAAYALVDFLTQPEQMIERARLAGQYPARTALYESEALADALPLAPEEARRVFELAVPRPVTPVYAELSTALSIPLHRALSGQVSPEVAARTATRRMNEVLEAARRPPEEAGPLARIAFGAVAGLLALGFALLGWRGMRRRSELDPQEEKLGWLLALPAVAAVVLIALFPLAWTFWESLHSHDLRMPWHGRPFVALDNYAALGASARFWAALGHTAFFTAVSVTLELVLGMALALILHRIGRGRGAVRAIVLLPWAIPTVVAGLVWSFMFSDAGVVEAALASVGAIDTSVGWLVDAALAWVPIVLADVWKTTPFVALLLLAGMQTIDEDLYDAAKTDGAKPWQAFIHITLPLLRPALLVVLVFRTLDAFRVFDLIYVLTAGGPGTATEPLSLYAFIALLEDLRFGYGSALAIVTFVLSFGLALLYVRLLGGDLAEGSRR